MCVDVFGVPVIDDSVILIFPQKKIRNQWFFDFEMFEKTETC
jgi:hypothetical protein